MVVFWDWTRVVAGVYRGTSLIGNTPLLGPYSRTIPRVLGARGGGLFLMSEVPLFFISSQLSPAATGVPRS